MKHPSQEDLLGFVLGALDGPEQNQIQQLIDQNPELEEELLRIKSSLLPLDELDGGGPLPGLARRTCEAIASYDKSLNESTVDREAERQSMIASAIAAADIAMDSGVTYRGDERVACPKPRKSFSFRERFSSRSSWSMTDMLAGVALLAVMVGILFPTISYTRFNSRLVACQNNLREIGNAMMHYSDMNEGIFVAIPQTGNLSASGCYAPILKDAGLVENDNVFACAGVAADSAVCIPSCDQMMSPKLRGEQVVYLQRIMGGHFGYTMGYVENKTYCPPKNMGRTNIVLLADQPSLELDGRKSANHGGYGQNCLFEDGHVEFVKGHTYGGDAIFENDYGVVAPGSNAWDNVIAPSHLTLPMDVLRKAVN